MSMHSAKGVYALLLGSGVSRSSAIPTGWDVVLDLIRKLAHVKGENCEPDPEAWYKNLAGSEPVSLDRLGGERFDKRTLMGGNRPLCDVVHGIRTLCGEEFLCKRNPKSPIDARMALQALLWYVAKADWPEIDKLVA